MCGFGFWRRGKLGEVGYVWGYLFIFVEIEEFGRLVELFFFIRVDEYIWGFKVF